MQARAQVAGVCTAAHRFAVRREDQRLDVRRVRLVRRLGETVMQALDRERRGDLADEAAGVREARSATLSRSAPRT